MSFFYENQRNTVNGSSFLQLPVFLSLRLRLILRDYRKKYGKKIKNYKRKPRNDDSPRVFNVVFFLIVRGARPGKNVQLTEMEIRGLCIKSREIFLSQPILLELEAPLKICGKFVVFKKKVNDIKLN